MKENGLDFIGDVKTSTKEFVPKGIYQEETRLAARAASAALEAKWAEQKYCSVQLLLTILREQETVQGVRLQC